MKTTSYKFSLIKIEFYQNIEKWQIYIFYTYLEKLKSLCKFTYLTFKKSVEILQRLWKESSYIYLNSEWQDKQKKSIQSKRLVTFPDTITTEDFAKVHLGWNNWQCFIVTFYFKIQSFIKM